ncbi:carboxymuconolactone decarboxylase family protein [Falsiroseomonas sp.]|uniref:carboxymuconolactone decarboxylase family protein n=1 Tax=Falsiroseomonas sp. TaxID=2870721 RepID=UPI00271698F4|nr:carboxymuconolactone decarboxylase family protein [Falsiroseomonas sp.]MDO9500393.1 carboxymuconolactone decarboxylase family protein [Falsiroseomonas sp.]
MSDETTAELEARLAEVRAKRGYLLPHHGLMALAFPKLLAGYDAAYTALALDDRVLSHHDREFVWMAVLAATDEALATHHIAKFRAAGGTDATIGAAFASAALAIGAEAFDFAARDWGRQLAPYDPQASYVATLRIVAPAAPIRLVHLAGLAVQVCRARWRPFGWHLQAAYADGVEEEAMAEAISLAMFPGSVPRFVEACGHWRALIADGTLPASPRFKAWAALTGQGGHDEATGLATPG